MALDPTVAGASSDSYLSVAAADAMAAADLGPEAEAWVRGSAPQKEAALRRATRELDSYLGSRWMRYDTAQARLFPRSVDFRGTWGTPVPFIPADIINAT